MRTDEVQVYETTDGWRWRYVNGDNGLTMADGGQGYTDQRDAIKGAARACGLRQNPLTGVYSRKRPRPAVLVIL